MFNHSHIRHFSSVFVSLRDFQLITQNSSENIESRQSRCIYVNDWNDNLAAIFETKLKAAMYVTPRKYDLFSKALFDPLTSCFRVS